MTCIPSPAAACSPPTAAAASATAADRRVTIVYVKPIISNAATSSQAANQRQQAPHPPRRPLIARRAALLAGLALCIAGEGASRAAILEAEDDLELLEKVKQDRKKRLERQEVISSAPKETGYLQDLVYKLSKVGQAIEKNDLSAVSSVLGTSTDADWVQKVNAAFMKLSSSSEEKIEVDAFNSSLASLITSVVKQDIESSKLGFVSSAIALEKWIELTGLVGQLKGL